jgi:hypothetical protein
MSCTTGFQFVRRANYSKKIELSKQFFISLQSRDFISLEKFDPSLLGDQSARECDNLEKLAALFHHTDWRDAAVYKR